MVSKASQFWNALFPIEITGPLKATEVRFMQSLNIPSPILALVIFTEVNPVHSANALFPTDSTVYGTINSVKPKQRLKADSPMELMDSGKKTDVNSVQFWKADLPISCFPQWDTQFLAFVAVSDYVIQFLLFLIHSQESGLGVSRLGKRIGQLIHASGNLLSPGESDG